MYIPFFIIDIIKDFNIALFFLSHLSLRYNCAYHCNYFFITNYYLKYLTDSLSNKYFKYQKNSELHDAP